MTASPDVLAAAKMYCDHGFAIVPVRADKKPFGENWRRHFPREEIFDRLRGPHCVAVGFLGGEFNNHIVPLDFDTEEGEAWWRGQCETAGIDPEDFPTVITPGKLRCGKRTPGRHRYVRDIRAVLGNSQGQLKALGIDVRGKGHAMLPPSPHPDGGIYCWLDRHSLDDFETIPACPDFIYDAIRPQKAEHVSGHRKPATADDREQRYAASALLAQCSAVARAPVGTRNSTLNNAALSLGHQIAAGRIGRRQVEGALLDAAEACGLVAEDGERAVRATIASGLAKGMEESAPTLEDRERARPNEHAEPDIDGVNEESKPQAGCIQLLTSADFVRGFVPPNYLLDGILQRGFLYSLTGQTGSGKTALALRLLASTALGRPLGGRDVEPGRAVMCVGENPDDVRARWIALAEQMGFDADEVDVHFIAGIFPISDMTSVIHARTESLGEFSLAVVDTGAAYFPGQEENDNKEQGDYARLLRTLTRMPGNPCALVNCHPIKNAGPDNLIPRGGGAFLNEMDGNLSAARSETVVELHWQGKFRGPDFEPMPFDLVTVTSRRLVNSKGKLMPTVIARPITEDEQINRKDMANRDLQKLIAIMAANSGASIAELATAAGWTVKDGKPHKSKVSRLLEELRKSKLVSKELNTWTLTTAGDRLAKRAEK